MKLDNHLGLHKLIIMIDLSFLLSFFSFSVLFHYPGSLEQIQLRRAIAHPVMFFKVSLTREQFPSQVMWDHGDEYLVLLSFQRSVIFIIP